ncbi:MAG: phage major tail tube protein [Sporomusaceae bacterium]|nr:phage major tail tube protein [Sporomusaceae bacterium]
MNQVPEKLISYRVYRDGVDLVGTADVQLPELEAMTETIKGAGIAGEVDSPVLGHYGSMTLVLNWRTLVKPIAFLSRQEVHALDLRGASQVMDSASGAYKVVPIRITIRATPKKTSLGKFEVGAQMESSNELEVSYIKVALDGADVIEIDKYNYIAKIDGVDVLADVRSALGLV